MIKKALLSLAVVAAMSAGSLPASAQLLQLIPQLLQTQQQVQLSCLPNAVVRAIQAAQNLKNVTQAAQLGGLTGRILTDGLQLCLVNGVYAWVFSEVGADGTTRRRVINANTGAAIPGV